jgi:hypothetical protein
VAVTVDSVNGAALEYVPAVMLPFVYTTAGAVWDGSMWMVRS